VLGSGGNIYSAMTLVANTAVIEGPTELALILWSVEPFHY
jgi:hypothetical protein